MFSSWVALFFPRFQLNKNVTLRSDFRLIPDSFYLIPSCFMSGSWWHVTQPGDVSGFLFEGPRCDLWTAEQPFPLCIWTRCRLLQLPASILQLFLVGRLPLCKILVFLVLCWNVNREDELNCCWTEPSGLKLSDWFVHISNTEQWFVERLYNSSNTLWLSLFSIYGCSNWWCPCVKL